MSKIAGVTFFAASLALGCSHGGVQDTLGPAKPGGTAVAQRSRQNSPKLYPIDESASDKSFARFRRELLNALEKRDFDFLLSIIHPDAVFSIEGPRGREGFRKTWEGSMHEGNTWQELREMLQLGSVRTDKGFCAPYVYAKFPRNLDPFEYVVVTGKDIEVKTEPSLKSPVIELLAYDIVKNLWRGYEVVWETRDGERYQWFKIETPSGKTGYVWGKFARSPVDLEVCFEKTGGEWMLISLMPHND